MFVKDRNKNTVELLEKYIDIYDFDNGDSIKEIIFGDECDFLKNYRKTSSISLSDLPSSLNNKYLFITKICKTIAIAYTYYNSQTEAFMIAYINGNLYFMELSSTRIT